MLEGSSNVVRIAVVERLGQVKRVQYRQVALLFRLVASVDLGPSGRQRHQLSSLHLVDVVATNHGDSALFGDEEHVVRTGKLDEAQQAPGGAAQLDASSPTISVIDGVEQLVHFPEAVDDFVVGDVQLSSLCGSINLQDPVPLLAHVHSNHVVAADCFVETELVHLVERPPIVRAALHVAILVFRRRVGGSLRASCRVWAGHASEGLCYSWLVIVLLWISPPSVGGFWGSNGRGLDILQQKRRWSIDLWRYWLG